MKDELAARRARIRRLAAKRPQVVLEMSLAAEPAPASALDDLLALLDERRRSGGR